MRMCRKLLLGRSSPRAISRRTDTGLTPKIIAVSFIENARGRTLTFGDSTIADVLMGWLKLSHEQLQWATAIKCYFLAAL